MQTNLEQWHTIAPGLRMVQSVARRMPNVLPASDRMLRAFELVGPNQVRVIILGQDPYYTPGKANGLAFGISSNWKGVRHYSSFGNISQEVGIKATTTYPFVLGSAKHTKWATLEGWAEQGVLLLNTRLSVEAGKPMSHASLGWNVPIGQVLDYISLLDRPIVWMLWGAEANALADRYLDPGHLVLSATHPSKYSASRATKHLEAFVGCDHFHCANVLLEQVGQETIDWRQLPSITRKET